MDKHYKQNKFVQEKIENNGNQGRLMSTENIVSYSKWGVSGNKDEIQGKFFNLLRVLISRQQVWEQTGGVPVSTS